MDKELILAVAGSGKTSYIIDQLNLEQRHLVITYTINNLHNLRTRIIKKWGYFPQNIRLFSYYNFLYAFCYKPYLHKSILARGVNFNPNRNRFARNMARYLDSGNRLYSNRISKVFETEGVLNDIENRLSKYFDQVLIDEIQDFAGHDFNFLETLVKADTNTIFVGDFYQHTFDTSRDGNVNRNIHNDYANYQSQLEGMGLQADSDKLNKSYRCSPSVCGFIFEKLDIKIESHCNDDTQIKFIENEDEADTVFKDNNVVKLFHQEHYKYNCYSRNWGGCKGEDQYQDVCVVLNAISLRKYREDCLSDLPAKSKNKLYVALSRARGDLYLVSDKFFKKYKCDN
jgi:DNA helicase-2/ATP-dependent DNA helicase PcrA